MDEHSPDLGTVETLGIKEYKPGGRHWITQKKN